MKKNCILVDFNVPDNWNFKLALEETMKTKWETLSCITNRLHGNKIKNCFRYIKYFVFSFKIFMNGLLLVFYCRLFKVKKVPDIYIMTFIYKPKKNKLYNKMIKYIVTSKYIKKLVVLSKSEQDYYSKIFNIDRNLFCVINIGVCDISSKVKKQENEEKYYLEMHGKKNMEN